jgi:hypothetical protein
MNFVPCTVRGQNSGSTEMTFTSDYSICLHVRYRHNIIPAKGTGIAQPVQWLDHRLENQEFMTKQLVGWAKDFSMFQCIWSCFGTYTVFYSIRKKAVIYSGLKWPRHEANHLLPSSVEDNEWNCTSSPLYIFMLWTGTSLLNTILKR